MFTEKIETKIYRMSDESIDSNMLFECAEIIKKGGVIAFPTETVYGLGANALDESACKKIYELKGRPENKALICHLSDPSQGEEIAYMDKRAYKLFEAFSPGPMTVVLRKKDVLGPTVTGGMDTVAIRMPSNKTFIELSKIAKCPIAGTSANISSRPSPKECIGVIDDFYGYIPAIIDTGKTSVGIESTIVSLVGEKPIILRVGAISPEEIGKVIEL
ncbi:MAG: threonylcarbamoyl-AMP synthase [Ruminococcaceae bacterium]|nr:threonylcarbamoyl-AMP synthase [Oscillospiraceae bacterium]